MKAIRACVGLMMWVGCGGAQVSGGSATDHEFPGDAGPGTVGPDAMDDGVDVPPGTGSYTIELVNKGDSELTVSVKKGWQPVVFAIQGKPPKATGFMLFPMHCMRSCDVAAADMCPVCEVVEENVAKRRKLEMAQKRDITAAPGESISIPWDGHFYKYEKAPAAARTRKKPKCQCYRPMDPLPGVYEFHVNGLRRPTTQVGTASRTIRLTQPVTWPLPAGSTSITFDVK